MAKADNSLSGNAAAAASATASSGANKPKNAAALTKANVGHSNSAAATGSETALKLKNLKGIHEDVGGHDESDAGDQLPLDAHVMQSILASMGAERHDPRVVSQLQEFVHRYVTEILLDAQEYAAYAAKQSLDADDIRLAITSRLSHHYNQLPSRELLMELADKRNRIPLPPIANEYGVRLPSIDHQLVTQEPEHHDTRLAHRDALLRATAMNDDDDDDDDGDNDDDDEHVDDVNRRSDRSMRQRVRPPLHPLAEGSRNKRIARHPIPIHLQQ